MYVCMSMFVYTYESVCVLPQHTKIVSISELVSAINSFGSKTERGKKYIHGVCDFYIFHCLRLVNIFFAVVVQFRFYNSSIRYTNNRTVFISFCGFFSVREGRKMFHF